MNDQRALDCWRRALMLPGWTSVVKFSESSGASQVAQLLRENIQHVQHKASSTYGQYALSGSELNIHGMSPKLAWNHIHGTNLSWASNPKKDEDIERRLNIHIEGWRGVAHAYALVAEALVKELTSRPAVSGVE